MVIATGAAFLAGLTNAIAGGGTLITFPTLVWLHVPPVVANATNTTSLTAGYAGSAWAQRQDVALDRKHHFTIGIVCSVGGIVGAMLAVWTGERLFRRLTPLLILFACVLLALQDYIKRLTQRRTDLAPALDKPSSPGMGLTVALFFVSVYGGYFGAGLGILLTAVLGIGMSSDMKLIVALKQQLSLLVNVFGAGYFVLSGKVDWSFVPFMAVGSWLGGVVGGRVSRRIPSGTLRRIIIALGVGSALAT